MVRRAEAPPPPPDEGEPPPPAPEPALDATPTPSSGKPLVRAALALLAPLALLAAVEGALRAFGPPPPAEPLERAHPLYRRVLAPKARVPRRDPRTGADVPIETNAFGLRARAVTDLAKPADAYRIVFLGGAPLEGAGLPEDATAPGRLETILNGRRRIDDDLRVEAVNLAAADHGLAEALALLIDRAPPLDPDMTILLPGLEDLLRFARPGYDPTRASEGFAPPGSDAAADWLERKLRLFGFARRLASRPAPQVEARVRRRAVPFTPKADLVSTVRHLKRYLKLIASVAREQKTQLVFATIPTLLRDGTLPLEEDERCRWGYVDDGWNVDPGALLAGLRAWNDELRASAAREGALIVDLDTTIKKDLATFDDEVTLTANGHDSVAAELARILFGSGTARRR